MQIVKPRVLVVDDSIHDCESYERALRHRYRLLFSHTGAEALEKFEACRPSLILLDYQLPDMTGLDFLQTYSKRSPTPPPSIVLTGEGNEDLAVEMMKSGARDYIVKDTAGHFLKLLPGKVEDVLRNHKQQMETREARELHDVILEMAGEGIVGLDEHGKILFANSAAQTLMKVTDPLRPGRAFSDFLEVRFHDYIFNFTRHPSAADPHRVPVLEGNFKDATGKVFPVEYRITPFYSSIAKKLGVVIVMQDISQRKQAEKTLLHMSTHDALTQLFNRDFFIQTVENTIAHSERTRRAFTLMFLDIDSFKHINDSFGHDVGDQMLKTVARRLMTCTRHGDVIARFGGDEFVLLMNDLVDKDSIRAVAGKIIDSIGESIVIEGYEFRITSSIGIARYPESGSNVNKLLRAADVAMYKVKRLDPGRYEFFDESLLTAVTREVNIEQSLHQTDMAAEFSLDFQPLVDPNASRVDAFEALLRWNHPKEGRMLPEVFIPVMERTHFINPVGAWVINAACRQLREWHELLDNRRLRITVNVSTRQLLSPDLTDIVRQALIDHGLQPQNLELEITETELMHNADACASTLRELQGMGVRIAVDDFGTGHSSLRYLKALPLNTLKLDKSFAKDLVEHPDDTAIIEGTLLLAHKLGLSVVAEGVENLKQAIQLRQLGVDLLQGHLYQRPLSRTAATQYLLQLNQRRSARPAMARAAK